MPAASGRSSVKSSKSKQTKKSTPVKGASRPKSPQQPPPNWPAITRGLPFSDLQLIPTLPDQILIIPHLWTPSLCKTFVSFLSALPLTTTPGKPKKGDAVRVNDRYQIEDAAFAATLWKDTALMELVNSPVIDGKELNGDDKRALWGGEVLGLNSNIRIYRYSKGQFFDQHCRRNRFFEPLHPFLSADSVIRRR